MKKKRASPLKKLRKRYRTQLRRDLEGQIATFEEMTLHARLKIRYKFRRYQPLPWLDLPTKKRQKSTLERWEYIQQNLPAEAGSALDLGCNLGFFTLKLAERGYCALGLDRSSQSVAIAQHAQRRAVVDGAAFSTFQATPESLQVLPHVDVVLFLSVYHHWIKEFGHEAASTMLSRLWSRAGKVLFFESGEDSEIRILGVEETPLEWVRKELERTCEGASVEVIGQTDRGAHKRLPRSRTLFAVRRER